MVNIATASLPSLIRMLEKMAEELDNRDLPESDDLIEVAAALRIRVESQRRPEQ